MKKYLIVIALLLLGIEVKAQNSHIAPRIDTFLSITPHQNSNTVTVFTEKRVVTAKVIFQRNIVVSPAVLSKFDKKVIYNYLLYNKQTAPYYYLISLRQMPGIINYMLYTKNNVVYYNTQYEERMWVLITLLFYYFIMFGLIWLLFWLTPHGELWTQRGELINAILGITSGSIFAFLFLEDETVLYWDQILVCFLVSVSVYFFTRWKYRKNEQGSTSARSRIKGSITFRLKP